MPAIGEDDGHVVRVCQKELSCSRRCFEASKFLLTSKQKTIIARTPAIFIVVWKARKVREEVLVGTKLIRYTTIASPPHIAIAFNNNLKLR